MTFEDAFKEELNNILKAPRQMQLYFVLKSKEGFVLRLADIEDEKTEPEIQSLFEAFIENDLLSNDDLRIRSLSTADDATNTVYKYDYETHPEELALFRDFDIGEAINIQKFNFDNDKLSSLFGYIVYIGSMSNGLLLFKKHYPISLIKRESFLLGAYKDKKRFEKLPSEDIIRLNGEAQLLRVNGIIYVLDIGVLQKNLGFIELITKAALDSVNAIESLEILDDIDVLKDTIEEPSFARKLSRIKNTSPIFRLGITKEQIVEFSKTNPGLAGGFKYSEDGSRIRLDTKKSKQLFLKMMNDSFLRSELTKQYYEASAKDNLTDQT